MKASAQRLGHIVLSCVLALIFISCGGSGGGGGGDTTPPRLVQVEALNNTSIRLTFSEAVGPSATVVINYSISPELAVLTASLAANEQEVTLTTASQEQISYTVSVQSVQDKAGNVISSTANSASFTGIAQGTDSTPPTVTGAASLSATEVAVSFSEPVNDSATQLNNYTFTPALLVTAIQLSADGLRAILSTAAQNNVQYTVFVNNVQDLAGNVIGADNSASFLGTEENPNDTERPRLETAISTTSNTFVLTFSEAMGASVEDIANYELTAPNPPEPNALEPQEATLILKSATRSPDQIQVIVETFSQSDVPYTVRVVNVRDLAGNTIDPASNSVVFAGTAETGPGIDSDNDGLSDAEEQRGWWVIVRDQDRELERRHVTSDPNLPDTDGDGLNDDAEKNAFLDPRRPDTDGDELTDVIEVRLLGSDGLNRDTDRDGEADGLEISFDDDGNVLAINSSPTERDSDGDGLDDGDDAQGLIAAIPRVAVNFERRNANGTIIERQNANIIVNIDRSQSQDTTIGNESSIARETASAFATSNTTATQLSMEAGLSVTVGVEATAGVPPSGTVSAEATASVSVGYSQENSLTVDQESSQSLQREFSELQENSIGEEITATGGSIKQGLYLTNTGDVPFTITNLELSVLRRDPNDPAQTSFQVLGALTKESGFDETGLSVGETKGPFTFSTTEIGNPDLLLDFFARPDSLIFRVADYSLRDQNGDDFIFQETPVNQKTALIMIDYGNGNVLSKRVSTELFASGELPLKFALQALDLDFEVAQRSGSTALQNGVNVLTALEDKQGSLMVRSSLTDYREGFWYLIGFAGGPADPNINFDELALTAGDALFLVFGQDQDGDRILAREEYILGTDDQLLDTDGDGLTDFQEAKEGWLVDVQNSQKRVFSDPRVADADRDGLRDWEEMMGCKDRDADLVCDAGTVPPTDPSRRDSNGDGIGDIDDYLPFYYVEPAFVDVNFSGDFTRVNSITSDRAGNVYVVGEFRAANLNTTGFIQKLSPTQTRPTIGTATLQLDWQFAVGGLTGDTSINKIIVGARQEDLYIVGETEETGNNALGKHDMFVQRIDIDDGSQIWERRFGTSEEDFGADLTQLAFGNIFVFGSTTGIIPGAQKFGDLDWVVFSLNRDGAIQASIQLGQPGVFQIASAIGIGAGGIELVGTATSPAPTKGLYLRLNTALDGSGLTSSAFDNLNFNDLAISNNASLIVGADHRRGTDLFLFNVQPEGAFTTFTVDAKQYLGEAVYDSAGRVFTLGVSQLDNDVEEALIARFPADVVDTPLGPDYFDFVRDPNGASTRGRSLTVLPDGTVYFATDIINTEGANFVRLFQLVR